MPDIKKKRDKETNMGICKVNKITHLLPWLPSPRELGLLIVRLKSKVLESLRQPRTEGVDICRP